MSKENGNQNSNDLANSMSDLLGGFVSKETLKETAKEVGITLTEGGEENEGGNENEEENQNQEGSENTGNEEGEENSEENEGEEGEGQNEEGEEGENENEEEGEEGEEGGDDKTKNKKGQKKPKAAETIVTKNKFGLGNTKKGDNNQEKKINISKLEQILPAIKSEFGVEVKGVKDVPKFFESAKKWRADSQALKSTKEKLDQAMYYLENAPEDIIDALKLHYNNQDYRQAFEKPALDFSKPVDKQDTKKLVNHYFPGKFKEEDFDAAEKSDAIQIAETAAKSQYTIEKGSRDSRAAESVKKAENQMKAFNDSLSSSVENFKTSFPDADEDALENAKQLFVSGKVMQLFFNPNGTLKPDALKRAMLATDGEDLIVDLMEIAKRQGESRANEEHVSRSASKQRTPTKGKGTDNIRQKVKDQMQESVGSTKKQYTY